MGGGNNNRCLASAVRLIMNNKPNLVYDCSITKELDIADTIWL